MAILNPEHLLQQAERLIAQPPAGPPRQADIRRAISAAYYGVFHALLARAADQFVGATKRSTGQCGLVYRSIDHAALLSLCEEVKKPTLKAKFQLHAPKGGFGADIVVFAAAFAELHEKRISADYDPMVRVENSDANLAVRTARSALAHFNRASAQEREAFLSLVLFAPRRRSGDRREPSSG